MNQSAIFYLLTSTVFYFSFISAQEPVCKLKQFSIIYMPGLNPPQEFNGKNVQLYKVAGGILQEYVVGEDSRPMSSERFTILICNTVIFQHKVEIVMYDRYITIYLDGNTFKFGRRFFAIDDFPDEWTYPVAKVTQDGTNLKKATIIKAKKDSSCAWIFIVLNDDNDPLILFPSKVFEMPTKKDAKVSLTLETSPKTPIVIEFKSTADADSFYKFVSDFMKIRQKYERKYAGPST